MNCCFLLILFILFGGNGCGSFPFGCCNGNSRSGNNGNDCGCKDDDRHSHCGCNDDLIQPRGFSGFSNVGTCGCEDKND